MGAEIKKMRCDAMVSTPGDWERCRQDAPVGTAGWVRTRFGQFCPTHAAHAARLWKGRVA